MEKVLPQYTKISKELRLRFSNLPKGFKAPIKTNKVLIFKQYWKLFYLCAQVHAYKSI